MRAAYTYFAYWEGKCVQALPVIKICLGNFAFMRNLQAGPVPARLREVRG